MLSLLQKTALIALVGLFIIVFCCMAGCSGIISSTVAPGNNSSSLGSYQVLENGSFIPLTCNDTADNMSLTVEDALVHVRSFVGNEEANFIYSGCVTNSEGLLYYFRCMDDLVCVNATTGDVVYASFLCNRTYTFPDNWGQLVNFSDSEALDIATAYVQKQFRCGSSVREMKLVNSSLIYYGYYGYDYGFEWSSFPDNAVDKYHVWVCLDPITGNISFYHVVQQPIDALENFSISEDEACIIAVAQMGNFGKQDLNASLASSLPFNVTVPASGTGDFFDTNVTIKTIELNSKWVGYKDSDRQRKVYDIHIVSGRLGVFVHIVNSDGTHYAPVAESHIGRYVDIDATTGEILNIDRSL